jgi:ATP-dependent Clp protease protease subunit
MANLVIAQLLFLSSEDPKKDINLYINSPGGSVTSGLAIYDTMQFVKPDISTICMGMGASMAQVLLCAGAKGKRFALPNARILMHQPSGGTQGQSSDIEIYSKEIIRMRDSLYQIIAKHTGKDVEQIKADADRDKYMSSRDAVEYGIIDAILETIPDSPNTKPEESK